MLVRGGDSALLSGTTLAAVPSLAGEVVADELVDFTDQAGLGVTGTYQTRVVRTAAGTLDFYFRVTRLEGGDIILMNYRFFGRSITADTDFRLDGLGAVGPSRVNRHDMPEYDIVDLNYYFSPAVPPGSDSRFVFVKTNVTDFERAFIFALAGQSPMWIGGGNAFMPPYS